MAKHWIKGAIGKPGSLHKQMGIPQGQKIPAGRLAKAASAGGLLGKRARLAETLGKLRSHLPKGTPLSPSGDLGARRDKENAAVGGFTEGRALNATAALPMRSKPTGLTGDGVVK